MNPNNNLNQKTIARAFYEVMQDISKSDDDPILLGWKDSHSQTSRFDVFVENCVENGDSVLDFGSGLCGLYGHLKNKNIQVNYTGIDMMSDFNKKCIEKYGDEINIINTNVLYYFEKFDWSFASGVFAVGFSFEEIDEYVTHFVNISNKGVCFNLLDKNTFTGDVQVSFDPDEVKEHFTNKFKDFSVRLITGYTDDDFTIVIKK